MASTADVSVLINDENDNPPVFHGDDDGVYRMNLSESTSIDNKVSNQLIYELIKLFK